MKEIKKKHLVFNCAYHSFRYLKIQTKGFTAPVLVTVFEVVFAKMRIKIV